MTDTLFPYYERELIFIRQFAQEFAKQYPAAAGRHLSAATPLFQRANHDALSDWAGTVNRKMAPCGSFSSAHNRPPCRSTMDRLMASPIPVPSVLW